MGLLETGAAALIGGELRTAVAARNIANVQTPGYKREVSFSEIAAAIGAQNTVRSVAPEHRSTILLKQGALTETGNALDLAINGSACFLVRDGEEFALSRGGQFLIDREGAVTDAQGRALQQIGGGDLLLKTTNPEILIDGTVLDDGIAVGSIALIAADQQSSIQPGQSLTQPEAMMLEQDDLSVLRQGMLEQSNVTLSDEMVELMRTQRFAESGAQLVRTYDQLIGQAIATFKRSQ